MDLANDLGKALANSGEYKEFLDAQKKLESNVAAQVMLKDFRTKQFELERLRMLGEDLSPAALEEFRSKQDVIMFNPVVREFLIAEQKFGNLMMAVQKIIGQSVGLDLPGDDDDHDCNCGEGKCGEGCSCS